MQLFINGLMHYEKEDSCVTGDGVGSELCDAALMVLEKFQLPIELTYGDIGWEC